MKPVKRIGPVVVMIVVALTCAASAAGEPPTGLSTANMFDAAIAHAKKRCVRIYGAGSNLAVGYATGLIVSPKGHILTAKGMYLNGTRIRVALPDGTVKTVRTIDLESKTRPLQIDEKLQAAVIKIDAETPDYFELSREPVARQGDWVMAMSNLYKVAERREDLSVELGVVALRTRLRALHRRADSPYEGDLILIDAITSNPGAAGGAVFTSEGKLVGMIGRLLNSERYKIRYNYAVPSDLLAEFVDQAIANKRSTDVASKDPRADVYLGIRLFRPLGAGSTRAHREPPYIERVKRGSPGDKAGLKPDDLILAVSDQVVRTIGEFNQEVSKLTPGREVTLIIKRKQEILQAPITPEAAK